MDSTNLVFYGCLAFSWIAFVWKFYLSFRQYRKYRDTTERPKEIFEMIDEETFQKSRSYSLDKARFKFVSDAWIQAAITVTLAFGLLPTIWNTSGNLAHSFCASPKDLYEICQSLIFVLIAGAVIAIAYMPLVLYRIFVIEEKHGFNTQTLEFFIKDVIKHLSLGGVIIGMLTLAGVICVRELSDVQFRELLKLRGCDISNICRIFLVIIIVIIARIFLEDLFDPKETLPTSELKTKIEALANRLEFPTKRVFVYEGSRRSTHSNAYFAGPEEHERIVLYDTILENYFRTKPSEQESINVTDDMTTEKATERKTLGLNDDEVLAVIGHELGHWKLDHLDEMVIIYALIFLPAFLTLLYKRSIIYSAFGFTDTHPTIIGLTIIFLFVISSYREILSFPLAAFSRRMEFAADAFSAELGYAKSLKSALIKVEKDNLCFPVDDWLYSAWYQSHPSVPERIAALKRFE